MPAGLFTIRILSSSYIKSRFSLLDEKSKSSTIKILTSSPVCRMIFSFTFTSFTLISFFRRALYIVFTDKPSNLFSKNVFNFFSLYFSSTIKLFIKILYSQNKKKTIFVFGKVYVIIKNNKQIYELNEIYLSENNTYGEVNLSEEDNKKHPEYMCQSGKIKWNLNISKKIAFNVGYGAGKLFRNLQAFEMFWHAEGMKTMYSGEIILDDEK